MKRDTLLILNGGHSEIPLIHAGKKMGFRVFTSGNDPHAIGHRYADGYLPADFSDETAVSALIDKHGIDFVIPSCNDFSILTASALKQQYDIGRFDDYETTVMLHHKSAFKTVAQTLGLSVAKSVSLHRNDDISDLRLKYPLIVKPIDLSGGKGVTKVETDAALQNAVDTAFHYSREDTVLIEEFIEGSHHSASLLIRNGKVVFKFFADEYFYLNNFLVEGAYSNPSIDSDIQTAILDDTKTIIEHFRLADGILHIQFVLRNGTPYILEVTRRSPGDLYLDLVSHSTGIDFAQAVIGLHTGKCDLPLQHTQQRSYILRHCVMADRNGMLKHIHIDKRFETQICDRLFWYNDGDKIDNFLAYKAGIVFASFDDMQTLKAALSDIHTLIRTEVTA